ncbi:hypothetical protein, partial [Acinetobacter baumannii]|uniref:hypothetical protein n=1 Tax=Acinetobacter baumannii TaxID=470 RepID=UPI000FB695A0
MQGRQAVSSNRQWRWSAWLGAVALACGAAAAHAQPATPDPQIAFYYGRDVPAPELQAFDWVVLDPAAAGTFDPKQPSPTLWLARVDLTQQAEAMRDSTWSANVLD